MFDKADDIAIFFHKNGVSSWFNELLLRRFCLGFSAEQIKDDILPLALKVSSYLREAYRMHLRGDVAISTKADNSLLTEADTFAHYMIMAELKKLYPDIPIVSEEGDLGASKARANWQYYWLVDPLDGTREFVEKTGEYTVNIALMKDDRPWLGVVILPQQRQLYVGGKTLSPCLYKDEQWVHLEQPRTNKILKLVVSNRSIYSAYMKAFIAGLEEHEVKYELVVLGSAYKYCELLKYQHAVYPRYGLTCHWDTAAGQALLSAVGGCVVLKEGQDLPYPANTLLNSSFLALSAGCSDKQAFWLDLF